jgi:hypothetical protein
VDQDQQEGVTQMSQVLKRPTDPVDLRAVRETDSMVMRMSRATAEAEVIQLEQEAWEVEIVELDELG